MPSSRDGRHARRQAAAASTEGAEDAVDAPGAASVTEPATAIGGTVVSSPATLGASLRRAGPLAIAGVVANVSNVLVTVVIAHLLTKRGYGSLTQLVAMFLVLSMPGSALLVAVVRRVAAWRLAGMNEAVAAWVARVRRGGTAALAVWAILALVVRQPLADLLKLPHPDGVTEILIAGGAWAMLSVERGLIQSRRAYGKLAANLCVEAGIRVVFTLGLVAIGLGVEGAALAVVGSMAGALVHARRALRPAADGERDLGVPDAAVLSEEPDAGGAIEGVTWERPAGRHLAADLATAVSALGLLAALQNLDVLIVGNQDPGAVGAYSAISVSSKAVVFAALVLCGYLLPEAVLRSQQGGHALRQLTVALALIAVPVAGLAGIALVNPELLLRVAFGPDKTAAAPALATMAAAMGCLAASVLFTHYLLGVGRRRVVVVLAFAVIALVPAVAAAHGRPMATARIELVLQGALACVLGALVLLTPRQATVARSAKRHSA
jgi:O-antigen/teichoic acid export membrane protein